MWKFLIAVPVAGAALCGATCIAIEGTQITARDVAQIDSAFTSVAPDLPFSYGPAIGKQRTIAASEIATWAAKAGIQAAIATPVCFERPAHKLSADEVVVAIQTAFPKSKIDRVDVLEICDCRVPAGRLQFTAGGASAPSAEHPETPVLLMGQVVSQSGSSFPVWARVRIFAPLPDVTRGSTVSVQVVNGPTRIALKARAENSANAGELVTLTNPSGLRRFRATVIGPGLAQIALSPASTLDSKEKNRNQPVTTIRGSL